MVALDIVSSLGPECRNPSAVVTRKMKDLLRTGALQHEETVSSSHDPGPGWQSPGPGGQSAGSVGTLGRWLSTLFIVFCLLVVPSGSPVVL